MKLDLDKYYDKYLEQYKKSADILRKSNPTAQPFDTPQSYAEFVANYNEVKVELKKAGEHRLSGTQIANRLAVNDVYEYSYKQVKAWKTAEKNLGLKPTSMQKLRTEGMTKELRKELTELNNKLKQEGKNSKDRATKISKDIFGSK